MRFFLLCVAVWTVLGTGCAGRGLRPSTRVAPRDPAPLVAALEKYNEGPAGVRLWGTLKVENGGSVEFGATTVENGGLRLDAVAGPFSSPVVALACRPGGVCLVFVPGRRKGYLDEAGLWSGFLGSVLRGRVPRLEGAVVVGAWDTDSGRPALVLRGDGGWEEQIEWDAAGTLPSVVHLSRQGAPPDARVGYGDFGARVDARSYPGRVEVWLRDAGQTYELRFRNVEVVGPGLDPGVFVLELPPGTLVESVGREATWKETGIPLWFPLQQEATRLP